MDVESRVFYWRAREDSNLRPTGPQPVALSTELRARAGLMVGATGFEPATSCTPCKRAIQAAPRPEPKREYTAVGSKTSQKQEPRGRGRGAIDKANESEVYLNRQMILSIAKMDRAE